MKADVNIKFFVPAYSKAPDVVIGDKFEIVKIPIPDALKKHGYSAFGDAMELHFKNNKFDLIVNDGCPLRWMSTMRLPNCPRIMISNAFLTGHFTENTVQKDWFVRPTHQKVHQIRREKGLPPLMSPFEMYNADLVLLTDPRSLFPKLQARLPENFEICGPVFWSAQRPVPQELVGLEDFVLISMGSTGRRKLNEQFFAEIRAFTQCETIIYAGHQAEEVRKLPDLDFAFNFLPLNRVLKQASCVVTQGGAGSTYQALSVGAPVISFPTHRNQEILGKVVEKHGLGACIGLRESSEILETMDFPAMRKSSIEFGKQVSPGGARAVKSILKWL